MDIFEKWNKNQGRVRENVVLWGPANVAIATPDWEKDGPTTIKEHNVLTLMVRLYDDMVMQHQRLDDEQVLWLLAHEHPYFRYYIRRRDNTVVEITGGYN